MAIFANFRSHLEEGGGSFGSEMVPKEGGERIELSGDPLRCELGLRHVKRVSRYSGKNS